MVVSPHLGIKLRLSEGTANAAEPPLQPTAYFFSHRNLHFSSHTKNYYIVCVCLCVYTSTHLYGSPRTTCKSQFSPIMWIVETERALQQALTQWTTLPPQHSLFFYFRSEEKSRWVGRGERGTGTTTPSERLQLERSGTESLCSKGKTLGLIPTPHVHHPMHTFQGKKNGKNQHVTNIVKCIEFTKIIVKSILDLN